MAPRKTVILVVDDDPDVLKALKFSLEVEGFAVHTCAGGQELLNHDALKACDCVVLDYKMPGMNGLEVLEQLNGAGIAAPVIFITGRLTGDLRRRAMQRGARLVLEKPLLDKSLTQRIHELTG